METKQPKQPKAKKAKKESKGFRGIESAFLVIVVCFIIAVCIYVFVLGDVSHFTDATKAEPKPGDLLGTIYKGGVIVPVLQTLLLTVLVKNALAANDLAKAQELCDKQKGSVGSVVTSALKKYAEMENNTELTKEQKLASIQKEVEEATALELPTLEMNLAVIATMTTLGTLVGLLGTVLGMIRSFAALATATGAPDSVALSTGISEALVNTAFGIATGACAVISYNFFTSKIDKITYAIDEVGFSIVQSYAANHSK